ncbi:ATP-dependent RNA helicase rok1 [Erysiphe neolycopersici]|uniref:ATP-dependent RNA helicase n=1 Tax=Erysiphe neolycopersici TaxID=212602 RepID=A0A420I249_9PEZI|nr:ATP-dependent RNA helicase rok1 [Erysiphe neolycopersici]
MDIFKILSRSTKLSYRNPNKPESAFELPSAGTSVNPQLYRDVRPDTVGKKRKRNTNCGAKDNGLESDIDINYFASKSDVPEIKNVIHDNEKPDQDHAMDESDCRKALQSHRIKITILKSRKIRDKNSEKLSKRRKVKSVLKQEFKQIYPQPLMKFEELRSLYRISNRLTENLAKQSYNIPTEIQMASLPLLLRPEIALKDCSHGLESPEMNLLAIAPTGSGKTLAFLIPIIDQILQRRRKSEDKTIHILEALVIAPTKELADQILTEAKILCEGTGVKVSGMRKGLRVIDEELLTQSAPSSEEKQSVDLVPKQPVTKADILITTPGIFSNSLRNSNTSVSACLPSVRTLVLDEADILLDPLFYEQTCSIWNALTCPHLRTTLWSATISSSVESLALSIIRKRFTKQPPLVRIVVGLKDSALPTISHTLSYCGTEKGKILELRNLLHTSSTESNTHKTLRPPIIIFTQTIPRATALYDELLYDIPPQAGGSSRLAVLHSSLSDTARSTTLNRFRSGEIWVLITTDILSRGVDFRGVNAVINYDIPNDAAGYIHRVGRTGRCGRKGGVAVTFYTREDVPYIRGVVNVIEASRKASGISDDNDKDKGNAWLLDILPKLDKTEKKKLKIRGVEARREDIANKTNDTEDKKSIKQKVRHSSTRISTRSGYERKLQNRRRDAIKASIIKKKRALQEDSDKVTTQ